MTTWGRPVAIGMALLEVLAVLGIGTTSASTAPQGEPVISRSDWASG